MNNPGLIKNFDAPSAIGAHRIATFYVPKESTYLLQCGERVLNPKQNIEISVAAQRINQTGGGTGNQSISFVITNNISVKGNVNEQNSEEVGVMFYIFF